MKRSIIIYDDKKSYHRKNIIFKNLLLYPFLRLSGKKDIELVEHIHYFNTRGKIIHIGTKYFCILYKKPKLLKVPVSSDIDVFKYLMDEKNTYFVKYVRALWILEDKVGEVSKKQILKLIRNESSL